MFKITMTGNVTADPEQRFTNDGKSMLTFRVAVNSREQNAEKEWEDVTYWFRVVTMPRSDYLGRVITKGAKVLVSGTAKASAYEPKDGGDPRLSFDLAFPDTIEVFGRLPKREDDESEYEPTRQKAASSAKSTNGSSRRPAPKEDDSSDLEDLPF